MAPSTVETMDFNQTESQKEIQSPNDSDSGLDTNSIGRQKKLKHPDATHPDEIRTSAITTRKSSDSGVTSDSTSQDSIEFPPEKPKKQFDSRRRRIPKLGLTIKQNPDLSYIRRKPPPKCISCDSELCPRQPLVKTNGILFMKSREQELLSLEKRIYDSVWDCAFSRSDIVADWTDDLKDHQDFCAKEITTAFRYKRKLGENQRKVSSPLPEKEAETDTGQSKNLSENFTNETDLDHKPEIEQTKSKKIDFSERLKKMKSKVQNTMQRATKPNSPTERVKILPIGEEFQPPPTARPKVKTSTMRLS